MKLAAPVRIVAVAAVLAVGLTGTAVREGMARAGGQEVVLAITGYDPRELLTGHYVQFQMRSEFAAGTPCPPGHYRTADKPTTWVALARRGDHHVPSGATYSKADALRLGEVAVRGNLVCSLETFLARGSSREVASEATSATLDLGIGRFHADQRQAEAMQTALQGRGATPAEAYAVVSVGRDGKARLKGLIVGGKRTHLDWF